MMLLSTVKTHFIAMDILRTTSCLLEKIMMFIKVYNDILLSWNHKNRKTTITFRKSSQFIKKELRGDIEEEEVTNWKILKC
jgi:hypothetical protein